MTVLLAGIGSATRMPSGLTAAIAGVSAEVITSEQWVGPLVVKS